MKRYMSVNHKNDQETSQRINVAQTPLRLARLVSVSFLIAAVILQNSNFGKRLEMALFLAEILWILSMASGVPRGDYALI